MFFKEPDKVRYIFKTQVIGYLVYLAAGGQQVSFGFQYDLFINKGGTGFAQRCFGNGIQLIGGKMQQIGILRYLFLLGDMRFYLHGQYIKEIVPVQFLDHTFACQQVLQIPDPKFFREGRLVARLMDGPYRYMFHGS